MCFSCPLDYFSLAGFLLIYFLWLMEKDEREIIYLALINQLNLYQNTLEDSLNPLKEEEKELAEYIFKRTLEIATRYEQELRESYRESTISRPNW